MACPNQLDIFRVRTEQLGETLYRRASWQSPILKVIPREAFPGYASGGNSVFTVQRSEPASEDETWYAVTSISQGGTPCANTFADTTVGYTENKYKPEKYPMRGPLICRNDLALDWNTADFWDSYFGAIQKRGVKSITNRQLNVYMQYVPKAAATAAADFYFVDGDIATQAPPSGSMNPCPDLTTLPTPADVDYCELMQDMLDTTALELMYAGATEPDSDGWLTMGAYGPEFPLLIGPEISQRLFKNNAELRVDVDASFMGLKDANPLLKRLGAVNVLKNFRHVINLFPPRWDWTLQGGWVRRNAFEMTDTIATKGEGAEVTDEWRYADYEGAIVLSPWVMHEQILQPINSVAGARFSPVNYMGDWIFATGTDALNSADCATNVDPFHDYGRHFAQYWHANKPIHPEYGRLIVFKRCAADYECPTCSSPEDPSPSRPSGDN